MITRVRRYALLVPMLLALVGGSGPARAAAASSRMGPKIFMPVFGGSPHTQAALASNNLIYHGGPIQKTPKVFITYWQWGGSDPAGEAAYLERFFSGIGGTAWAEIQTQYDESARGNVTNPVSQFGGSWYDDASITAGGVPALPDFYMQQEVGRAVDHFGYDPDANYIIATPHLHNNLEFDVSYCAWHSEMVFSADVGVAFTDLPYIPDAVQCGANSVNSGAAGALDGVSIVAGHEYAEAVTDPHINAWTDAGGQENGDKCAWVSSGPGAMRDLQLSTGSFAVQSLWSNAIGGCTTG